MLLSNQIWEGAVSALWCPLKSPEDEIGCFPGMLISEERWPDGLEGQQKLFLTDLGNRALKQTSANVYYLCHALSRLWQSNFFSILPLSVLAFFSVTGRNETLWNDREGEITRIWLVTEEIILSTLRYLCCEISSTVIGVHMVELIVSSVQKQSLGSYILGESRVFMSARCLDSLRLLVQETKSCIKSWWY